VVATPSQRQISMKLGPVNKREVTNIITFVNFQSY
jgi:hypothetical protein